VSWFLQVAIEHALTVINWHENLPKEEVPPEHLWADAEGLEQWWARVESNRDDGITGDDDSSMEENDYARALKG
jgi:hypothetical protein